MNTAEMSGWPQYSGPAEALRQETSNWGERLDRANLRYDNLDGELGASATRLAIGIIDANERAEHFYMLKIYKDLFDDETSAALLLVNHDEETPPERTEEMLDTIRRQREETNVAASIAIVGYPIRGIDQLRQDVWDIATVHGLRTGVDIPIIGVSNDFDMTGASSSYWQHMTRNTHVGKPARMWSSKVIPTTYGSPDTAINKLVHYLFTARSLMTDIEGKTLVYGASTATTLDTFASTKGWVGALTAKEDYGIMEPSQLALNILERASGTPVGTDRNECTRAIMAHAHPVPDDGFVTVSSRRETVELARYLVGEPYPIDLITTRPDNSYRRLSPDELANITESVHPRTERIQERLGKIESIFRDGLDEETSQLMGTLLRVARQDLDLPEPKEA